MLYGAGEVADADPGDTDAEALTAAKKSTASNPTTDPLPEQKKEKSKKRPAKNAMTNKVVTFAPEANITFGDDIPDDGKRMSLAS